MLFAFVCTDKPGHLQVRLDNRPAHVEWLKGLNAEGKIALAGPFSDEAGQMNGSLVIVDAPDLEAAKAMSAADPYAKAGLFESVQIRPWNWTFNKPEGN